MAQAVSFHWGMLGKPDFSQCAALVERLPEQLRSKLRKPEEGTLKWITFLLWTYASHSGRGAAYCIPSQRWLAGKVHRSERTVRRCLTVLREMKLISYLRRRPVQGEYRSNLYTLGKAFMAGILYRLAPRSRVNTSGQKCPPITSKKEYESLTPTVTSDTHKKDKLIARQTDTPLADAGGVVGALPVEDTTPRQPERASAEEVVKPQSIKEKFASLLAMGKGGKREDTRTEEEKAADEVKRRQLFAEQLKKLKAEGDIP